MLESLYAGSLADAESRKQQISLSQIESLASTSSAALDALTFLAKDAHIKVLAEIKRASPSKGSMAEIAEPAELAKLYAENGASAISVLTEQRKFLGSLNDLRAVRAAVDVPLLRKDFIANEYQILEARAAGADIVLLIVAGIDGKLLTRLKAFIEELGMTAFVETHNADEVRFAVDIDARLLGVNARDLSTFETDRDLFAKLNHLIPESTIKVAESAVREAEDVRRYRDAGADVVLVGEALVTGDAAALLLEFTAI